MATNGLQNGRIFSNWIGGESRPSHSGELFENRNPADRDERGHYNGAEDTMSDHGPVEAAYLEGIAAFA